jgi:uncharacterized membrane protein
MLFFSLSLTPSLLPRDWLFQGLVSGISAGIGYGIGVMVGHIVRWLLPRDPSPATKRLAWRVLIVVAIASSLGFIARHPVWQEEIHLRMGVDPPGMSHLASTALAIGVFVALLAAGRTWRKTERAVSRRLHRWIPPRVAAVVGTVLVTVVVVGILDGVVLQAAFGAADRFFHVVNETTREGVAPPTSSLRSGGPESLAPWQTLGVYGKDFVAAGPTMADLQDFSGRPAAEPIRVYVGLDSGAEARARAALAVQELERTGAFQRQVLCIIVTTGTGWVNPVAAAALEYLYNGDTALVAMQYSYLPSWISFLVDQNRAAEAGQELFNQVYERWSQLPEDTRPRLLVYGESLGSFASESAFSGLADVRNRVDGALWVGPPNFNPLWRGFVERRDAGSPQRVPVFDGGRTVRFAGEPSDLAAPGAVWRSPRVVYLQHASDPIVWWSPRLALRRPDWLAEPRGPDVLPNVRWYPFVTFWQVSADMTHARRVPAGYGHLYGTLVVDAWAAIAPPSGWTPAATAELKRRAERLLEE